jgi:DNA repair protein RadD
MILRDYQKEAITATFDFFRSGGLRGIIVIPTGGGKSLILGKLIEIISKNFTGFRALILTHVKELIEQNEAEFKKLWPNAETGIFSAGIGRKEIDKPITFAGIQSFHRVREKFKPAPDIVFVDECHLINSKTGTTYFDTLNYLRKCNPKMKIVGLTATPFRLSTGYLHTGEDRLFDAIIYKKEVSELIDEGFLCRPTTKATKTEIDVSQVKHGNDGDFQIGDLERAMMSGDNTEHAVKEIIAKGQGRRRWIVFASGVKHALEITDTLSASGISSRIITGATKKKERKQLIQDYRAGVFRCVVNVGVLTTGFNVPEIDLLAMLRPTESAGLYIQIIGRGMRNAPGKKDCLVLDFAGNVMRHGPIDAVLIRDKKEMKKGGEAPAKCCPECFSIVHLSVRECPDCGFLFPEPQRQIDKRATEAAILKADIEPDKYPVKKVELCLHEKAGKAPSVKVEFVVSDFDSFSKWIAPESKTQGGLFYYRKFCHEAGLPRPFPETAKDFVENVVLEAEGIEVDASGKYPEIKKIENLKAELIPF